MRISSLDGDFLGWRCISCGEILDEVILENRQAEMGRQSGGVKGRRLVCLFQKVEPQKFKKILDSFLPNRVSYLPIVTQ